MRKLRRVMKVLVLVLLMIWIGSIVYASPTNITVPKVNISISNSGSPKEYVDNIKLLMLLTSLAFIPTIILMMTCFTRIIIVLGFLRNALSTQQTPPNQVLIGLALFMTLFIMSPVYSEINNKAIQPYIKGQITQEQAMKDGSKPLKEFMLKQTREKDLALFYKYSNMEKPKSAEDVSLLVLVPAYVTSELKTAFQMGVMLYIPFIVIDMVVASVLMSMGMFMLPPVAISLPLKLLLFVMADGWHLVIKVLLESFK